MINLKALKNNYLTAMKLCASYKDALKYLLWLYSCSPRLGLENNNFIIKFKLDEPLGDLELNVRSNRGSDAFIFSEVFIQGCYDVELPIEPKTILDLGGNIGLSALYFSKKYPHSSIATVEPMPDNLEILNKNITTNSGKIKIFPVAVSTQDGVADVCVAELDYDHHIAFEGDSIPADQLVQVKAMSMKSIVDSLGWDKIDLLKMDIEGYEKVLLSNNADWLWRVNALCIEIHGDYSQSDLNTLANLYDFSQPKEIPGGLWLLVRNPENRRRIVA